MPLCSIAANLQPRISKSRAFYFCQKRQAVHCLDVEKIVSSLSTKNFIYIAPDLDEIPIHVIRLSTWYYSFYYCHYKILLLAPAPIPEMEGLLKCDQSWKRVILNNQATIGHFCVAYLIQGVWKGGPASANTPSKNKQKAGGGTEQKKSGTPLKLLLLSL